MHYLKCNNCGHFNELKTEYLVFCSHCSKKMPNNYSDWAKKHTDKSFEDFKSICCTTKPNNTPLKKQKNKSKTGLTLLLLLAIGLATYTIVHVGSSKITSLIEAPVMKQIWIKTANEINTNCPLMIDNITRLDNAMYIPKKTFQYTYTLVNMPDSNINTNELKANLEPNVTNFVKTNPDLKMMRDHDMTLKYYYQDINKTHLFTITVTPDDYK